VRKLGGSQLDLGDGHLSGLVPDRAILVVISKSIEIWKRFVDPIESVDELVMEFKIEGAGDAIVSIAVRNRFDPSCRDVFSERPKCCHGLSTARSELRVSV